MTSSGVHMFFRQEADGKLYVRYQVIGRNHVAVPTHFFKVSPLDNEKDDDVNCQLMMSPVLCLLRC